MLDVSVADTCTYVFDKISHAASLNKLPQAYLSEMAIHLTGIYVKPLNGDSAVRNTLPAETRSLLTNLLFLSDNGLMGMADCLYNHHWS